MLKSSKNVLQMQLLHWIQLGLFTYSSSISPNGLPVRGQSNVPGRIVNERNRDATWVLNTVAMFVSFIACFACHTFVYSLPRFTYYSSTFRRSLPGPKLRCNASVESKTSHLAFYFTFIVIIEYVWLSNRFVLWGYHYIGYYFRPHSM